MTISERHFEAFCKQSGLECTRLPETEERTADYSILIGGQTVIAEVKEIEANEADLKALRDMETKHSAVWGPNKVGSRVRNKIDAAKQQIARLAAGKCPGILVLYDARPELVRGIWSYEILVGMYGFETIDLHVSEDRSQPVQFGTHRFGKGKKVRHDSHTYISALGVLREVPASGQFHMTFFINVFADHPLPLARIVPRADMTVYTLAPGRGNEFRGWEEMVTEEEYREANKVSDATSEPAPSADSSSLQG